MVFLIQWTIYIALHLPLQLLTRGSVILPKDFKIETNKPLILVANHGSRLDPFLLLLLPMKVANKLIPLHFLTAQKYFDMIMLKPFLYILGAYPIKEMAWTIEEYLGSTFKKIDEHKNVMFFPEGQLTRNRSQSNPKPGIMHLVTNKDVELLPVHIRTKPVILTFGKPLAISREAKKESFGILAKQIVEDIYSLGE
jgi:1-acyl-sn-glycerol-3-phosphate acyltransferase